MGSSTSFSAACTTRSATVGMPSLRIFPLPPGLGIMRSRTGIGRNAPALTVLRRSSRNFWTPESSTSRAVRPSTPADLAPVLPATRYHASFSVPGSCTRLTVTEAAARIGHRPAVQFGLHLRYP